MKNTVQQFCDVLLENIQKEFNEKLDKQFEDAGGAIDRDELDDLKYNGIEDIINELSKDNKEQYQSLKNHKIDEYIWEGNLNNEDKNLPANNEQYFEFHKKLEKVLRHYLSNKHNIPSE